MSASEILTKLIQFPSETPASGAIFDYVEDLLKEIGFSCHRIQTITTAGVVENLYAKRGHQGKHLAFAGHLDVVPAGNESSWTYPPYVATIDQNQIIGRGAVDMKGAIAAFFSAMSRYLTENEFDQQISLLITGDEEGEASAGTVKLIEYLKKENITPDLCLVGEPTSHHKIGDTVKTGRRGSLSCEITVKGIQGHVAYPDEALNPIHELAHFLHELISRQWDEGTEHFQPSHLEVTSISPQNMVSNLIPESAKAAFNIRYNTHWDAEVLLDEIFEMANKHIQNFELKPRFGAQPFISDASDHHDTVLGSIEHVTGNRPVLSTSGGTSDARFIHQICPTLELGLRHQKAHQIDESVSLEEINLLEKIYFEILCRFFVR